MNTNPQTLYVITKNTRDYPGLFVVRKNFVFPNGRVMVSLAPFAVEAALKMARRHLPAGLTRLKRNPTDDPVIVETWL